MGYVLRISWFDVVFFKPLHNSFKSIQINFFRGNSDIPDGLPLNIVTKVRLGISKININQKLGMIFQRITRIGQAILLKAIFIHFKKLLSKIALIAYIIYNGKVNRIMFIQHSQDIINLINTSVYVYSIISTCSIYIVLSSIIIQQIPIQQHNNTQQQHRHTSKLATTTLIKLDKQLNIRMNGIFQMFKNQNIIAIQKIREDKNTTGSWNNSNIKWFIVCSNNANGGKFNNYQIALDMVYLSSKREVRLNGQLVYTAMATFGFQCQFTICQHVQAKIKQNGINFDFQLYINEKSFSELQKNKPKYEGINSKQLDKLISKNQQQKKWAQNKAVSQQNPPTPQTKKPNLNPNPAININISTDKVYSTTPLTEAQKIKQTQNQLLKILKAERSKKN